MNYQKTLNLPRTEFSMRASLKKTEPRILERWDEENLYGKLRVAGRKKKKYILHDGPPYANGDVHMGTAFNKISKDIVVKYRTMRGYDVPFVPGWDCHGMPIEHQVMRKLQGEGRELSRKAIRSSCRQYARHYINVQREQFKRLGIIGDWERPYLTMDYEYEARIVEVFAQLVKKGFIYRGRKPVCWCIECETALAEAEVEYANHTSPSVYIRFPLSPESVSSLGLSGEAVSLVVWTTTPWTLPGNVAVALHPQLNYLIFKTADEILVMAEKLAPPVTQKLATGEYRSLKKVPGRALENLVCRHPFLKRDSRIILAGYVSAVEGTGCVHTAPGHGREDYEAGVRYKLPLIMPVDEKGEFTKEAERFSGMNVFSANRAIIERLKAVGCLIQQENITHSYPHCWRCRKPVIFRATKQWFMNVDHRALRHSALTAIKRVEWYPALSRRRMESMMEARPDWCLSRQRNWGVPIPVLYCRGCGGPYFNERFLKRVAQLIRKDGSDVWYEKEVKELLPPDGRCMLCGSDKFKKETDILDVWFDSAISHLAVLTDWPADLYLEGSDQHRGWFQVSLLTSLATRKRAPYRAVLTHGYTVDGKGRKMSKSLGNLITSDEVVARFGADIIRLWAASENSQNDIRFSDEIVTRTVDSYRKIRNTFRFLLGNLYDFNPGKNRLRPARLLEIDRWAISSLHRLLEEVTQAYEEFMFYRVFQAIYNFTTTTLSSFYLDVLKDRLYTMPADSRARRSAQSTLYELLEKLTKMLAPILSFTSEEVFGHFGGGASVYLASWPKPERRYRDRKLEERWEKILALRTAVLKKIEEARCAGLIGSSLEARVTLFSNKPLSLGLSREEWEAVFIVSQFAEVATLKKADESEAVEICPGTLGSARDGLGPTRKGSDWKLLVKVEHASGKKCARCWRWQDEVGADSRHPQLCGRCIGVIEPRN